MVLAIILISTISAVFLYYYIFKTITEEIARKKTEKESNHKQDVVWVSDEFERINTTLKDLREKTSDLKLTVEYLRLLESKRSKSSNWLYDPIHVRVNVRESKIKGATIIEHGSPILSFSDPKRRDVGRSSINLKDYKGESLLYEVKTP